MRLYAFLRACAQVIMRLLFAIKLRKNKHAPMEGGCIIAVNHISFWDPLILALAAPKRHLTFMARSSLFSKPVLGWALKRVHAVPVNRDTSDSSALRTALTLLKEGKMIGIYPQGTRQPDVHPSKTQFESGATYMAMSTGIPIVPVGVATKNYRIRWFRRISVVVGDPIYFQKDRDRAVITQNNEILKKRICDLCDEAMQTLRRKG